MYIPHKRSWLPWVFGVGLLLVLILLFSLLRDILMPFIVAAVLAYILNPLVVMLQKRRVKRTRASLWVMVFTLLVLVGLLLVIVPMLVKQIQSVIGKLPLLIDFLQYKVLPWYNGKFGEYARLNEQTITEWLQSNATGITSGVQNALKKTMPMLLQQGTSIAGWLSDVMLLPLLLYYFLLDWSRWGNGLQRFVPRRYVPTYTRITRKLNDVLSEFLRGQLMVMIIMGLVYGLGLMLTGLESGFAIGMVAGLLVFIPYLGAFTGLLLATLAAVLQFGSWHGVIWVWVVFGIGQTLESFFITPQIVGDKIGLSPFWVIFALMAFGSLMGFAGMLVALPLVAICLVLLEEGSEVYLNSRFYLRKK